MSEVKEAKKRGRKPLAEGGSSTPQKVVFVIGSGEDIERMEMLGDPKDYSTKTNEQLTAEIKDHYISLHGSEPDYLFGPFRDRKGTIMSKNSSSDSPRRQRIIIDMEKESFVNNIYGTGVYKVGTVDWSVKVRFVEGRDDVGFLFFKEPVDPNTQVKSKPGFKIVNLDQVKNLNKFDSSSNELITDSSVN